MNEAPTTPVQAFGAGVLVNMLSKPEWGPGKIVHVSGDNLHIIFRDLDEKTAKIFKCGAPLIGRAEMQTDSVLDNLPPLTEKDGRWELPRTRLSLAAAKRKFLHFFPQGFVDPKYLSEERTYKLDAHQRFQNELNNEVIGELLKADDIPALVKKGQSILGAVNVLSRFESAALSEAMRDVPAARGFYSALLTLLTATEITAPDFQLFLDQVGALPAPRGRVASWPVTTILLFLAQPRRFMFLKPEVTQAAAETLAFDLQYNSAPNWTTYSALIRMGNVYLELLTEMGAQDFIDVQSFIYVVGGGYD
jgi:hypothetical protein